MNFETYLLGKRLDSANYRQVQNEILPILEKGCNLVIDMTPCTYISSAGLRVMLYSRKVAASRGLNIYLVGVNEHVKDVMDITGFAGFFKMFSTMEACLEELKD
jgi:anti-sigma B factor antagonist